MPIPIGDVSSAPMNLHGSVDNAMSAFGGMDSEGFLKLLVAQLRYQSPLEPQDPGDMMIQTATLAQLDATQQLIALQQRDLGLQQAVAAAGLLGATVSAVGDGGSAVEGVVEGIRYSSHGPILDVGGQEVLLGNVLEVRRTSTPTDVSAAAGSSFTEPSTSEPSANRPTGLIAD